MVGVAAKVAKSTATPRRRHRPANAIILIESKPCAIKLSPVSMVSAVVPSSAATSARIASGLPAEHTTNLPI
jgi:hypothetical protein